MKHYIVTVQPEQPQIIEAEEHDAAPLALDYLFGRITGIVQVVPIPASKDLVLVIDECGRIKGLPINIYASKLAKIFPMDQIVGPAMIAKQKGPELWPLDESELSKLHDALLN